MICTRIVHSQRSVEELIVSEECILKDRSRNDLYQNSAFSKISRGTNCIRIVHSQRSVGEFIVPEECILKDQSRN